MKDEPKSKPNPKLDKFLKEINNLGQKYKFRIVPTLRVGADGIIPSLQIVDIKEEEKRINGDEGIPDIKPKKKIIS